MHQDGLILGRELGRRPQHKSSTYERYGASRTHRAKKQNDTGKLQHGLQGSWPPLPKTGPEN